MSHKQRKQPSSLSLAERLAFFSSLSEGGIGAANNNSNCNNNNNNNNKYRTRTSSYTRSQPNGAGASAERCHSNGSSSNSSSSNSSSSSPKAKQTNMSDGATPTPTPTTTPTSMECSPAASLRDECSDSSDQCSNGSTRSGSSAGTGGGGVGNRGDNGIVRSVSTSSECSAAQQSHACDDGAADGSGEDADDVIVLHETPSIGFAQLPRMNGAKASASTETLTPENVQLLTQHLQLEDEQQQQQMAALTPTTRRMKLRTVGKLVLPSKFANTGNSDRNNNNNNNNKNNHNKTASDSNSSSHNASVKEQIIMVPTATITTTTTTMNTIENPTSDSDLGIKKIGKIKSPFIENQQQKLMRQSLGAYQSSRSLRLEHSKTSAALSSLENIGGGGGGGGGGGIGGGGVALQLQTHSAPASARIRTHLHSNSSGSCSDDANVSEDSGKENYEVCCSKSAGGGSVSSINIDMGEHLPPVVVEMRKKLTRLASLNDNSSSNSRNGSSNHLGGEQLEASATRRSARNSSGNRFSRLVDERYAKFFGLKETATGNGCPASTSAPGAAAAATTAVKKSHGSGNNGATSAKPSLQRTAAADHDDSCMTDLSVSTAAGGGVSGCELTPIAAFNVNVRKHASNSSTPNPLSADQAPIAVDPTVSQKRRDVLKRPHTMSVQLPSQSPTAKKAANDLNPIFLCPSSSSGVSSLRGRTRPATITEGVRVQWPVQNFEDLVVTKEELRTAVQEFDRLFSGAD